MSKRKIRLKEVSSAFDHIVAPIHESELRVSAGRESQVGEFYRLETSALLPYPNQARKSFDDEKIDELAKTISLHGIRQPLTVKKCPDQLGKYYVVSGERRLRAAKSINLEKVPCIILDDADNAEEIALVENIQRADLHPIELAYVLNELLEGKEYGSKKSLSDRIGLAATTISEYVRYSHFPDSVKNILVEKDIRSRSILRRLLACDSETSMKRLLGVERGVSNQVKKRTMLKILSENGSFKAEFPHIKISNDEKIHLVEYLESVIRDIKASI